MSNRIMAIRLTKRKFHIIALLLILFFTGLIFAQENSQRHIPLGTYIKPRTDTTLALTEERVIERALENSRKLHSLNTNVEIATHRLGSSGKLDNPELRLSDVSTRYYTEEFDELQLGLRFRIPRIGELAEDRQDASVRLWERKVDEMRYRQQLVARVRRTYADVLMLDRMVELDQQRVELENKRIKIIEKMVDLGNRSIVYYTKAKMNHQESKNEYSRTIQRQNLARRKLAKRSGVAEDTPLVLRELPEINLELEEILEIAFKNRPEMILVNERIELAVKQQKMENLKLIPWPKFIEFSYHHEKKHEDNWGEFRAAFNLPLFDWNMGNIRATKIAVKKKEDELDAIRESIEEEVRDAYTIYSDMHLDWKTFRQDAINHISNANKVISEAKIHQTLITDEIFEMEWTIIDTQKLLSEKRRNLADALTELYYAIGIEKHSQLFE